MKHIVHPIPLVMRGRPMSDSVYRMAGFLGPVSVVCCYVWYIEGPKQKILVDSGMNWETYQKSGSTGYTHVQTLKEGLAKYGLEPADIDIVIQTHLHIDHRASAAEFTKARFVIQQAEIDYTRNPSPPPVDPITCSPELLDKIKFEPVKGDTSIVEGVRTLFTPGHTPGGQSVAVDTAKGLAIIDSLCTTDSNWNIPEQFKQRFEVFCPALNTNPMQAYESLIRIKKMADIRIPIHEPRFAFMDKIPA